LGCKGSKRLSGEFVWALLFRVNSCIIRTNKKQVFARMVKYKYRITMFCFFRDNNFLQGIKMLN